MTFESTSDIPISLRDIIATTIFPYGIALASRPAGIVDSFKPELVYWILVGSLLAEMISAFFWMGMTVRYLSGEEQ